MAGQSKSDPDPLLDGFSRHIIGLCVHYHYVTENGSTQPVQVLQFPGVLAKMHGHHVFLTAGHNLDLIEEFQASELVVVDNAVLIDHLGPNARDQLSIPFDLANAVQLSVNDEDAGLDFGLIRLDDYYLRLLEAQGVMPLGGRNFASGDEDFWQYFVIGFPTERIVVEGCEEVHVTMDLVLIPVFSIAVPNGSEKRFPRFVGEIRDMGDLKDIDGMSGGPVFGVLKGNPCEYRLVAIQSSWLSKSKVTFATPITVVRALINQRLLEGEAGGDDEAVVTDSHR